MSEDAAEQFHGFADGLGGIVAEPSLFVEGLLESIVGVGDRFPSFLGEMSRRKAHEVVPRVDLTRGGGFGEIESASESRLPDEANALVVDGLDVLVLGVGGDLQEEVVEGVVVSDVLVEVDDEVAGATDGAVDLALFESGSSEHGDEAVGHVLVGGDGEMEGVDVTEDAHGSHPLVFVGVVEHVHQIVLWTESDGASSEVVGVGVDGLDDLSLLVEAHARVKHGAESDGLPAVGVFTVDFDGAVVAGVASVVLASERTGADEVLSDLGLLFEGIDGAVLVDGVATEYNELVASSVGVGTAVGVDGIALGRLFSTDVIVVAFNGDEFEVVKDFLGDSVPVELDVVVIFSVDVVEGVGEASHGVRFSLEHGPEVEFSVHDVFEVVVADCDVVAICDAAEDVSVVDDGFQALVVETLVESHVDLSEVELVVLASELGLHESILQLNSDTVTDHALSVLCALRGNQTLDTEFWDDVGEVRLEVPVRPVYLEVGVVDDDGEDETGDDRVVGEGEERHGVPEEGTLSTEALLHLPGGLVGGIIGRYGHVDGGFSQPCSPFSLLHIGVRKRHVSVGDVRGLIVWIRHV
jgi:hypothetical protein